MARETFDADAPPPSFLTLRAFNSALGRAPLWLVCGLFTNLLALAVAVPWFGWVSRAIGRSYEPGSLLASWDETFRIDHASSLSAIESVTSTTGAVAALMAMLVGVFTAGGWLQVFLERTAGHSLRRFFYGGSRYFFRFLRVLFLTLLSLHLVGWVIYGLPWDFLVHRLLLGIDGGDLNLLDSERTARRVVLAQDGLFFLGVSLVLVWGDYTRTRLAAHDTSSALWAGLCSWVTLVAHPIRALRPMVGLWLLEAAVLWAAALVAGRIDGGLGPDSDLLPILMLFGIGQGLVMFRSVVRGSRYAAALLVTNQVVRPLSRPDPWKKAVGGPGGPQYPIGGDEYGVSL